MASQLMMDLGFPPTARNSDPPTSHIAAANINAKSTRCSILFHIMEAGTFGLATFEMALKMVKPRDYISPHMRILEELGLVERAPFTRKNPMTKNMVESEVWIVTNKYLNSSIPKVAAPPPLCCPTCRKPI